MAQGQGASGQKPLKAETGLLNPRPDDTRNGTWWMSLSDGTKNNFVDGYKTAMIRASSALAHECADGMKKVIAAGVQDPAVKQAWNLCVIAGSFDFEFEQRDLAGGLDEFYKNAKNTSLPVDVALQHVRDVLKSKKPPVGGIGGH